MVEIQQFLQGTFDSFQHGGPEHGAALIAILKSLLVTIVGVVSLIANSEHPFLVSGVLIVSIWLVRKVMMTIFWIAAVVIVLLVIAQLLAM